MHLRLTAACAALLAVLPVTLAAAAPSAGRDVVGGPLLAGRGVIVQPLDGAPPLPRGLSARGWIVADLDTGDVLAAKAPHERALPASTLKVLTAVTLLPRLDPATLVPISWHDAAVDGSKVGLVPGMRYSVDVLFKSMLVVSANDAANALAEAAGGTAHTVDLMNEQARHLQAYDTLARTPSGLDATDESTSAYDLALLLRAGLAMPAFRHYVGITMSHVPAPHHKHYQIYTHNQLLTTYPGMIGGKNGYTVAAHATYVAAARRNGHTIVVAMVRAQPDFWGEARSLFDWGFRAEGHVIPVGTLVSPLTQQTRTSDSGGGHKSTIVLSGGHRADAVSGWQLELLAVSAAVAVLVTARRQRRRAGRRLSLPPL